MLLFYWIVYNFCERYFSKIKSRNIIKLNIPFYFRNNNPSVILSYNPNVLHVKIIAFWKFATIFTKLMMILIPNFKKIRQNMTVFTLNKCYYLIYNDSMNSLCPLERNTVCFSFRVIPILLRALKQQSRSSVNNLWKVEAPEVHVSILHLNEVI